MSNYYIALLIIDGMLLVSLVFMTLKNSIMKKNQRYGFLIDSFLVASVIILEIITNHYDGSSAFPTFVLYVLDYFYFVLPLFVPLVILFALPSHKKLLKIFMLIEAGFSLLILVFTVTGLFFYIDENNLYHRGQLYFVYIVAYAIGILYLMFEIIRMTILFQNKNKTALIIITIFLIVACVVQLFLPDLYIAWSIISALLFVFYAYCNELWQQMDSLTNLLNQSSYQYDLNHIINNAILIIFDLDDFKSINDDFGHQTGDIYLAITAKALLTSYSKKGRCYRIGGDEFCVIFRGNDEEEQQFTEDFYAIMKKKQEQYPHFPSITVGNAKYKNGSDIREIAGKAEANMFLNKDMKKNGNNGISRKEIDNLCTRIGGQAIKEVLDDAINKKEFKVFYQPKYDAITLKLTGAEALVRWKLSNGEFVQPDTFIPSFEREGIIPQLDEYIFRDVCTKMNTWQQNGLNLVPVSINLSRISLCRPTAADLYKNIVNETSLDTSLVPIEITESAAVESTIVKEMTDKLFDAGFPLHLDDFGSGYSSLASLNNIRFSVLKLDKSIVDHIGVPSTDSLISHVISFSHENKIKVIAEGVEIENQVTFLQSVGCDAFQGFYFSKPVSEDEFEQLLAAQH